MLIRDEDALGARGDDGIMEPHAEDGHRERADRMDVCASLIQGDAADRLLRHHLRERIPCADIQPRAAVAPDGDARLLFDHGIIEADLRQILVAAEKLLIAVKGKNLLRLFQGIAETKGEYAAVPKRSLRDVLRRGSLLRLSRKDFTLLSAALLAGRM